MNILIPIFNLNIGGTERVLANLINGFIQHKCKVTAVLIKHPQNTTILEDISKDANLISCQNSTKKAIHILKKELNSCKYDLVFSSQRGATLLVHYVMKLFKLNHPHVIREQSNFIHHTFAHHQLLKRKFLTRGYKKVLSNAQFVILHNPSEYSHLKRQVNFNRNANIFFIDNPLNVHKLIEKSNDPLSNHHQASKDYIIAVGRLIDIKRHDFIIRSFSNLKNQNIDLVIVGSGPLKMELEKLSENLNIKEKVHFMGQVGNPFPLMKNAKLLVHASSTEGFGMVVAEALVLGKTVVGIQNDNGPEHILKYGKYGYLSLDEEKSFAAAIDYALKHPIDEKDTFRRAMDFSMDNVFQKYIRVFQDVKKGSKKH